MKDYINTFLIATRCGVLINTIDGVTIILYKGMYYHFYHGTGIYNTQHAPLCA